VYWDIGQRIVRSPKAVDALMPTDKFTEAKLPYLIEILNISLVD